MDRNAHDAQTMEGGIVALRKESVDRNLNFFKLQRSIDTSLSARRAWIEIDTFFGEPMTNIVALRKESVDRNTIRIHTCQYFFSRSPQGERG